MTLIDYATARPPIRSGVRLYRFSVGEYHMMGELGILHEDDPIELIGGLLVIKSDIVPPYGVPTGIPPGIIWPEQGEWGIHPLRRLTVAEYERIVERGILDPAKRHEMIEGWVVEKMTHKPRHDYVLYSAQSAFIERLSKEWCLRVQSAVTLDESAPEPDFAIVPAPHSAYMTRHPTPSEIALLVEVSDATYAYDMGPKMRSYARNAIEQYWIIDVNRERLHVFGAPSGPVDEPQFAEHRIFTKEQTVPIALREHLLAKVRVRDLLGIRTSRKSAQNAP